MLTEKQVQAIKRGYQAKLRKVTLTLSLERKPSESWRRCLERYLKRCPEEREMSLRLFDEYIEEGIDQAGAALSAAFDTRIADFKWG